MVGQGVDALDAVFLVVLDGETVIAEVLDGETTRKKTNIKQ